jgi:tRNA(Arg) A34 adenosine deaminase TadA
MSFESSVGQHSLEVTLPQWTQAITSTETRCVSDEDRMRVAIALSRENVLRDAGGPFGAAVFERNGAEPIAVGVNSVERLNNAVLHAEVVALMLAQARLGSFTLRSDSGPQYDLFTSCEPCAMCLGAALWSGVARIVCGAGREDATELGFDEGPVFPSSYLYLEERGIEIVPGILTNEARLVFALYRNRGGLVYNG